jgi:transglutaminase-like putative cysteine protease
MAGRESLGAGTMGRTQANLWFSLALVMGSCWGTADGQTPGTPPPIAIKLSTDETTVDNDGLATETSHLEITPSNDAAAKSVAQQAFPFSDQIEELVVNDAYTQKSDGRKLPVDPSQIFVQAPQNAAQAPMFSDQKTKVVVFPDVAANDTLVFTLVRHQKIALFPGQFFDFDMYPRLTAWNEARGTITAPKSLPLNIEGHQVSIDQHIDGDKVIYRWHYTAPIPLSEDIAAVAPVDREPRLFVSTFKNYDELGRAYATLAMPKAAVTPKVRSLADEITAGIKDRRAQAQKMYEWVSQHIRYVGIELGRGGVVPHEADTILANGYGDCKDHVVLFAALLQAKGIKSEMALINFGNSYVLPEAPTLAQLNHVITWLPEFKIYADTTAALAPFGTLPFLEYGKPVVHAVNNGPARHTTPVLTPGNATMSLKTVSHMTADGHLQAETTTTATGSFSFMLRQVGAAIQRIGPERAVQGILQRGGMSGKGSFDTVSPPSDLGPSYAITAHYDSQASTPATVGQGFPMPPGLRLLPSTGDFLMGPLFVRNLPISEPTPCWSGTAVEELSVEPPPGKHFVGLPTDVNVHTDNLTFSAHWSQADRIVSVRREFTSHIEQALCSGEVRKATADALSKIAAAFPMQISFVDD